MKSQKLIILQMLLFFVIVTKASLFGQNQMVNLGEFTILPSTQVGIENNFENAPNAIFINDGEVSFYRSLFNDGLYSFLNTGSARFIGDINQTITGNNELFFYNVEFNNSSAFEPIQVSGTISIENIAQFENGIVNNRDVAGTIQFLTNAAHSSTSNASFVNGEIIKFGNTPFVFPIGNEGFYRPSSITAPLEVTDSYSSTYFLSNSDTSGTPHELRVGALERIDDTEYWEINRVTGTSEVMITLSWNSDTTPSFITNANPQSIHIAYWDEEEGFWVDKGGIPNVDENTVTTFDQVNGSGIYTLALLKEEAELPDDLIVYNSLTPNDDGKNDFLRLEGIDKYPNNTVKIFNRNGVKVFDADGYNNTTRVFRGISERSLTIAGSRKLPAGTYFYIIEYDFPGSDTTQAQRVRKAGYLYITTED